MGGKQIPLERYRSGDGSDLSSGYFCVFDNSEGELKPVWSEGENEGRKERWDSLLYKVIEDEETFELAKGESELLNYSISIEQGEYISQISVEVNTRFPFFDPSEGSYPVFLSREPVELEGLEERENELYDQIRRETKDNRGEIAESGIFHMRYVVPLKNGDLKDPEKLFEDAGEVLSDTFCLYSDLLENSWKKEHKFEKETHIATSIFHPEV